MKSIITFLTLFISSFSNQYANEIGQFGNEVKKAYDEYLITEQYENANYALMTVCGIIDDQVRYGVFFRSDVPNNYYISIRYNGKSYKLKTEGRGDVNAVAFNLETGDVFSIYVYNRQDILQTFPQTVSFSDIRIQSIEDFRQLEGIEPGEGKGTQLSEIKSPFVFDAMIWIYIGAGVIILFCIIILFIFYKRKMGMFNDDVKSKNVFNFREFLNTAFEEEQKAYPEGVAVPLSEGETEEQEEKRESYEEKDSTEYVYHSWGREDEETSGYDIKQHLIDNGFLADYRFASETEKNQIMLELMKLRDQGLITKDDYLQETAELWKK